MKKLITTISTLFFVATVSAKADVGVGIAGAMHLLDGSGAETTRQSGQVNNGSHDETASVPEFFIEAIGDDGVLAMGISYIPTRDMGSKSRTDSNSEGDSGTYKAAAELDNVLKIYTDIPAGSIAGYPTYLHLGVQHVTLSTLESLNSGSAYPNQDLLGGTIGFGTKGELPYGNMYYKGEVSYTNFEKYEATNAGNKVTADLEDFAARIAIGYKF